MSNHKRKQYATFKAFKQSEGQVQDDDIQSLFRYVSFLSNEIEELKRKNRHKDVEFQRLMHKFKCLRSSVNGFKHPNVPTLVARENDKQRPGYRERVEERKIDAKEREKLRRRTLREQARNEANEEVCPVCDSVHKEEKVAVAV